MYWANRSQPFKDDINGFYHNFSDKKLVFGLYIFSAKKNNFEMSWFLYFENTVEPHFSGIFSHPRIFPLERGFPLDCMFLLDKKKFVLGKFYA